MYRSVNEDDSLVLEDLVDDAEVSAARPAEAVELPAQRLAGPMGVDRNRVEDRCDDRGAHLLRQPIELAPRLGCRLDRVRRLVAAGY